MAKTESLGKLISELMSIGTFILPYELIASHVVAVASRSMCLRCSLTLNLSSLSARVSDGSLPATNMLSMLNPILCLSFPPTESLPLNLIRFRVIIAKTVSAGEEYTILGLPSMVIFPRRISGIPDDVESVSFVPVVSAPVLNMFQLALPSG